MKKTGFWATAVAMFLATQLVGTPALAQQFAGAGSVAIIDLSYIFKNHNRFKSMTDDMRRAVEQAENDLKARRSEIEALEKRQAEFGETYKKDSPEFKQLDADITRRKIDLNAQIALQKKEFLEREAKIYYNVYQEIIDTVKYHCQQRNISLVLRFNGDPVADTDPQEILKQLNKSVVYHHQAIDITPHVLQDLNARAGDPGVTQRPGVPIPRR